MERRTDRSYLPSDTNNKNDADTRTGVTNCTEFIGAGMVDDIKRYKDKKTKYGDKEGSPKHGQNRSRYFA